MVARGHGVRRASIATAGAGALTEIALSWSGTERVEIHGDVTNLASAGVPRRIGFRLAETRPHEPTAPGESGRRMIWVMSRAEHALMVSGRRRSPRYQ